MSFFSNFARWMATSTSVIGSSVLVPTIMGVVTHAFSWETAVFPVVGSLLAIIMPQVSAPPAAGVPVVAPVALSPVQDILSALQNISSIAASTRTNVGSGIAVAIPAALDLVGTAMADYNAAAARLAAVQAAAKQSNAPTVAVTANGNTAVPAYVPAS